MNNHRNEQQRDVRNSQFPIMYRGTLEDLDQEFWSVLVSLTHPYPSPLPPPLLQFR